MHTGTLFRGRFHVSLILDRSPLKRKRIQCFQDSSLTGEGESALVQIIARFEIL